MLKTRGGRVVITRPPTAIRFSVHIDSGGLQDASELFDKVARNVLDELKRIVLHRIAELEAAVASAPDRSLANTAD